MGCSENYGMHRLDRHRRHRRRHRQAADAGKDPGGCIITVLLGIAGALLAGFIGQRGWHETEGAGFVGAIVGAFLILLIYRLIAAPPLPARFVQKAAIAGRSSARRSAWEDIHR